MSKLYFQIIVDTIINFRGIWSRGKKALFSLVILSFFGISCSDKNFGSIELSGLKCDYRENPLGVENNIPKLSWLLHSSERDQKQSAYHILVASNLEKLNNNIGDVWDSRKVKSGQSVQVPFRGIKLESCNRYYWKVRVWDKSNNRSAWSEPAFWEMGLLTSEDWKAQWIAYESESAPIFRKEFKVSKEIKDARVYISGLGYYELSINGSRIGDHMLDPAQTDYEQRVFYVVYDVTKDLKQGHNVIGVVLGNGWYHQTAVNHGKFGWENVDYGIPRLICQMHLTFSDGSQKLVVSDETWNAFPGSVISNNVYAGEQYDARLEAEGWDSHEFDATNWNPAKLVGKPGGKFVCQDMPPIKKIKSIIPVNISNPRPGVYVFDMGQNFAGWTRLKLNAERGTEIQLRFAEWLGEDGMIDPASTGVYATGVVQTDKYICKGNGVETWEPKFTYHGFQYVEMTGFPGIPTKENLEGIVVHTSLEKSGEFECSDSMINKLHKTALWTLTSNLHSIPTDCPHRERCGWLGDAFLVSDMTIYNFDAATFWIKFIHDIETSRREGIPTNIAPGKRFGGIDPDWGTAFIKLPWNMFLYYNDKTVISDHYEEMAFFMNHLEKMAEDNIIYKGIGSLFSPGRIMPLETPKEFTATALFYFCSKAMARMSQAVDNKENTLKYLSLAQGIKSAFNNKFYDESEKTYGDQERNTLALAFSLVPEQDEKAVARNLNRDVAETHNGHISTGIFGSRYIHWVLSKYGYGETVKNMLHKNTFPGYGYLFSRGATTFWENWGELKFEDRNSPGDGRSKSHPFQGSFTAWFYNGIGGINPDPENPGFRHIILRPQFIPDLTFAKAHYTSMYGLIKSEWKINKNKFNWDISIPTNTTASVYIPVQEIKKVRESNDLLENTEGVKFLKTENGSTVFMIGSGDYTFSWSQ